MKRRKTRMAVLLARLGWTLDPWQIPCHDQHGRRTALWIEPADNGVVLNPGSPGPLRIGPLSAGRLRNALRDALATYSEARTQESVVAAISLAVAPGQGPAAASVERGGRHRASGPAFGATVTPHGDTRTS